MSRRTIYCAERAAFRAAAVGEIKVPYAASAFTTWLASGLHGKAGKHSRVSLSGRVQCEMHGRLMHGRHSLNTGCTGQPTCLPPAPPSSCG